MSQKKDALQVLGELFILGFSGLELSSETSSFLNSVGIGGVILFSHNYENPAQVAELCNQVQECRRELPLWVSVDCEGGRVQRFKKGFTRIPDAAAVAKQDSPQLAFEIAAVMARELKAVGINLNFGPVADIATNPKNPTLGNRAFGATEEIVSKMCTAMVRGQLTQRIQPCVKHFPGHGDTSSDSHYALPSVNTPMEVLLNREFKPFLKAFKSGCSFVMTTHVIITQIDPKVPATLSSKILQDILRKQLRYDRLIVSDDMEMKAIADHFGAEEAPRMALEAGCDLLIYRTEGAARIAYDAVYRAIEEDRLAPEIILAAAHRSRLHKKNSLLPYHSVAVSEVGQHLGTLENLKVVQQVVP